jgi:hypothetical protein
LAGVGLGVAAGAVVAGGVCAPQSMTGNTETLRAITATARR